jgi:hypothetical protein
MVYKDIERVFKILRVFLAHKKLYELKRKQNRSEL